MHQASRSHRFLRLQSRKDPIGQSKHATNPNRRCLRPANPTSRQLYLICDAKHCRQIVRPLWQTRTQTHILYILYILYCTYKSHTHVGRVLPSGTGRKQKRGLTGWLQCFASPGDTPLNDPCLHRIEHRNCTVWEAMVFGIGAHRTRQSSAQARRELARKRAVVI